MLSNLLTECAIYSKIKDKNSTIFLQEIKKLCLELEQMIIIENSSSSNKSGLSFGFDISNKFSEKIDYLIDKYNTTILKGNKDSIKDSSPSQIENHKLISNSFEGLITKTIHNSFFKKYIKDYSTLTITNNQTQSYSIQIMNILGLSSNSNNLINTKLELYNKSLSSTNSQLTNLYLQDEIFNKKCFLYSFIKLSDLDLNSQLDEFYLITKLKGLINILTVKSAKDKLNVISEFYINVISLLDNDSFDFLLKFSIWIIIKLNIPQFKSNIIFIRLFRLKNCISSEEDFYLSIMHKAILCIESLSKNYTNKDSQDSFLSLVRTRTHTFEEYMSLNEKIEFLNTKFNQKGVLNPITQLKCTNLLNDSSSKNMLFENGSDNEYFEEKINFNDNITSLKMINSKSFLNKYYLSSSGFYDKSIKQSNLDNLKSLYGDFKFILDKLSALKGK